MIDEQEIIEDLKETIHRLQKECAEKTNSILALGNKHERFEETIDGLLNVQYELAHHCKRYHQALEDIENNIKGYCWGCKQHEPDKRCQYCNYNRILKIIKNVR